MPVSDNDYVNFSQDYELNYVLTRLSKRLTESNRFTLRAMGVELKANSGKGMITHKDFFAHIETQPHRLE